MRLGSSSYMLACVAVLAAACSDRAVRATPREDSGGIVLGDSGARDAGAGVGGDAAAPVVRDAGVSERSDAGAASGGDAGPPRSCTDPVLAFPAADAPRCSVATRTAMEACAGDVTCVRTAASADTTVPLTRGGRVLTCSYCLSAQQKYCIAQNGCAMETEDLECCIAAHCPDGSCTDTTCASELGAWQTCAATMASAACLSLPTAGDYAVCFATR